MGNWYIQSHAFTHTLLHTAAFMLIVILSVYILTWIIPSKKNKINCIDTHKRPIKILARDFAYTLCSVFVFALCTQLAYTFFYQTHHSLLYANPTKYGWAYFIASFPILLLLHDTYFYWTHRMMHHRYLFKWVHKTHHLSLHPTALSAFSFSPIEAVVQCAFIIFIPAIIPISYTMFFAFTWFVIMGVIYGHNSHDKSTLKMHQYGVYKVRTTPTHHALHHARPNCNYGLWFVFWDKIMSTEHKAYTSLLQKFLHKKNKDITQNN